MSEIPNSSENVEQIIHNSKESITSQVNDPVVVDENDGAGDPAIVGSTAVNVDPANGVGGPVEVNTDESNGPVDPNAVNVGSNELKVDEGNENLNAVIAGPTAANDNPNAADDNPNEGNVNRIDNPDTSRSLLSRAKNLFSKKNTNATANAPANTQANTQENAPGKSILSRFNPFTKAVANTVEITGTARDGSLRINLYKVDTGFAAEVIPITGENIVTPKNLPLVADLSGKPIKLGIDAAVTNKQAGGKSRKRRTIRKNGGYNSARFFSITKKRVHRNKSANKKHYVNKTLRK